MARTLICLRYFLVGGAIVVGICGAVESICAGYFIYQLYEYAPLTPNSVCGSSATLLAMGLITCLVSWCAWQFVDFTNRSQVIIFVVALMIITVVETCAGIWAVVRHEEIDALSSTHLEHVFSLAATDDKSIWDRMQSRLHCCGVDGPADYRGQDAIPWSCCDTSALLNASDTKGVCTSMYARGCHHVTINRTRSTLLHVFLLALCKVLLQIGFITCMCCYTKACRERMEKRKAMMIASQTAQQAPKDSETNDNLLNRQSKYSKTSDDVQL